MIKKMLKCSPFIIIASLAITAFFGWQLRKISIENTVRMYRLRQHDGSRNLYGNQRGNNPYA